VQDQTTNTNLYEHTNKQQQPKMPKNEECSHPLQNKSRAKVSERKKTTTQRTTTQNPPGMRSQLANCLASNPVNDR
jgi:hypothetical protein